MQRLSLLVCASALALLAGCASSPPLPPPLEPAEIVRLSKEGMPAKDIIARLHASQAVYTLDAAELVRLSQEGVPVEVLNYLQATQIDQLRREAERQSWYGRDPFFWGPFYRPWPAPVYRRR